MAGSTDARYRFCANVIVIVMKIAISGPTRGSTGMRRRRMITTPAAANAMNT